ncbi:MAG: GNAT family N-acetyltransferase [Pseudonocardiales bacterium]|nr:MAG: GNAT family N-acetyltransferase [Pseudonocardiales bacterium]
MDVRRARVEDALAVAVVHVRSWQAAYRGLVPQDYLDGLDVDRRRLAWERILAATDWPRAGTLVAEIDGEVIGFANICPTRDDDTDHDVVGEVSSIYVVPERWATGAGRRLMAAAVRSLTDAGFSQATLWVLDANTRARRFYEAGTWRPDGATKQDETRGFPLNEVWYRCSLLWPRSTDPES